MEVLLSSDLERKLAQLADARGSNSESLAADLVSEAVERMSGYDEWFLLQVEKGLTQIEDGRTLSHEVVGQRLDAYLAGKSARSAVRD